MRTFQPVEQTEPKNAWGAPQLPLDRSVAIYPRQSTMKQVGNVATEMQTDDLITFAQRYGWKKEQIIMYLEDLGVSGRLRMDEREGFTKLLRDITTGKAKAVIAFQVDRLFRDEWGVEYGKFMEICYTYGVIVVTPEFIYDFSVDWHVDRFRRKCEEAYSYLRQQIKGRLIAARDRLARQGFYTCGGIPTGYIVDRRLKIDGLPNPYYRKYILYEPHARIVRRLFARFRELGGKISQLYRELRAQSVVFPTFDESVDPRTISKVALQKVPGGYHISLPGLTTLLTNPVYIGWWMFKDEIISRQHHEPLVDEELFWYAFNRLSRYTIEGSVNEAANSKPHAKYTQKGKPESEALLKDVIHSSHPLLRVYVNYDEARGGRKDMAFYTFRHRTNAVEGPHFVLSVSEVDGIFVDRLLFHLRTTADFESYRTYLEKQQHALQEQQADIQVHIVAVRSQMATIELNLKSLTNPRLVANLNETYTKLEEELARLESSTQSPQQQQMHIEQLLTYYELMSRLDWQSDVTIEEKKVLITLLVQTCTIDILSPRFYKLVVQWRVPTWGTEEAIVHRGGRPALHWSSEEDTLLRASYYANEKAALLALFPSRSWESIYTRAARVGLRKGSINGKGESEIPNDLCLQDYHVMQQYAISVTALTKKDAGVKFIQWSRGLLKALPPAGGVIVR
ncbi:MAG: recombinase family protein [Ktedonobacteraceae bacterium]